MKEVELFYLTGCPYCEHARKAIDALKGENPAFRNINVTWIEENQEPERVEGHDYYYVPSVFVDGKKVYEAQPGQDYNTIKGFIREALNQAL